MAGVRAVVASVGLPLVLPLGRRDCIEAACERPEIEGILRCGEVFAVRSMDLVIAVRLCIPVHVISRHIVSCYDFG